MKLADYLAAVNETQRAFAERSGVPYRTVHRICRGAGCQITTAQLIVRATHARPTPGGGAVTFEEIVPSKQERVA